MNQPNIIELKKKAVEIRKNILKMLMLAGSGQLRGMGAPSAGPAAGRS